MKTFPLKLTPELHKEIKLKAIDAGKSMHQYILDCIKNNGDAEYLIEVGKLPQKGEKPKESKEVSKKEITKLNPIPMQEAEAILFFNCQKCNYPLKAVEHTCK